MLVAAPSTPSALTRARREARRLRMVALGSLGLLAGALLAAPARDPIEARLLGAWQGTSGEQQVTLVFRPGGQCALRLLTEDGTHVRALFGQYRVWALKRPVALTIDRVPELTHPLHATIRFHGEDELELSQLAPRWRVRPLAATGPGSLRLRRLRGAAGE